MKCDIIIAVWNRKELTRSCIESIAANTRFSYRIIIIDNASQEPTRSYLESLRNDARFEFILIRNEENLGNTMAVNQGLKAASAELICNLNNDTMVTEGWLEEMAAIANADKNIGMVVPSLDTKGLARDPSPEDLRAYARQLAEHKGQYLELGITSGFCLLIKRAVVEKIGLWDEVFSPGYFDDTEYIMRAKRAGFIPVSARGAFVYHREHGSFKDKNREAIFSRNRQIYQKMYGKPKRILYVIDRFSKPLYQRIEETSLAAARATDWVWIFKKDSLPELGLCEHGGIRHFAFSPCFFWSAAVYKVLVRKKKFDSIYVLGSGPRRLFNALRFIHKAQVEDVAYDG
ncbi:glycosyltransferase family 2 protein [Candidatus Omnitrophota bacterium]